jgi:serine/threonine-protein kinase PknK
VESAISLPARYQAIARLGGGGGGEVWEVQDRFTHEHFALKVLAVDATEHEMAALVRETIALSGLEGIGLPRVMRFGRLPHSGRPYLIRELVRGSSLEQLLGGSVPTKRILVALAKAAEQLTLVHRAGFFHGDVKPANIIVSDTGVVTLVDLGLAAPWRDAGVTAPGLTPKYAAPELLGGRPLTVRAEVYALGIALREAVERGETSLSAHLIGGLLSVAQRATAVEPEQRYPSVDEFATALRQVALLEQAAERVDPTQTWPIVGNEGTASRLLDLVSAAKPGSVVQLCGPVGSGRSVLLRRLAWSLGVEGRPLVWFDSTVGTDVAGLRAELEGFAPESLTIIADDIDELSEELTDLITGARQRGSVIVLAGNSNTSRADEVFEVPPLGEHASIELLRRAVPSLTERLARKVVLVAGGIPGRLKHAVALMAQHAAASEEDVERLLSGVELDNADELPKSPLERALYFLQRGRYKEVQSALERVQDGDPLVVAVAKARLEVGLGEPRAAYDILSAVRELANERTPSEEAIAWRVWFGRACVGVARYSEALEVLSTVRDVGGSLGAFALAFEGLAYSHIDNVEAARSALTRAIDTARAVPDVNAEGFAHACAGAVLSKAREIDAAQHAYERALTCCQNGGDAGTLCNVQLNLAVLHQMRGDVAASIEYFQAAADMGRRSGRRATIRNALLNLAHLDLMLGRLARARASIEAVEEQREVLPAVIRAQLKGVQAELAERTGDPQTAIRYYRESAEEWESQGSGVRGAEARLEAVLTAAKLPGANALELTSEIARATSQLGETSSHRHVVALATAKAALVAGDETAARTAFDEALLAARENQRKEWEWRVLAERAELEEFCGQKLTARRDRIEAVTVLEQIAAKLPRDLREVFWNDPRRRSLRASVEVSLGSAETHMVYAPVQADTMSLSRSVTASQSATPYEQRLGKLLEVNRELLGELDLSKLTTRVAGFAVELVNAERGLVILRDTNGVLQIYSSSQRAGDPQHLQFSRSIAERVMDTREAFVSLSPRDDQRMRAFQSVHHLSLESVVCVPIIARETEPLGALYVENRHESGKAFQRELPTLRAFADQVALAFETARLVSENASRAKELEIANEALRKTQAELKEALGDRTERLRETRKALRETRDTLYGHFGYQGIVGNSGAMRRCYSLIERVKDTDVPVLITGESGTGKEVAARAIHRASDRAKKPFLGINCGAIPEHLLESELFGHVRGAFTGAERDKKGLIRDAQGGAVLLDEIGEMPHKMQAGLLRVLQEHKVRPVGGSHEETVDCRFIFATHRDLKQLVAQGKFREDLYYRIHVVELPLPPLRDRLDDLPLLVDHFLGIFAARYKREKKSLSKAAHRALLAYTWPGNVRQLEHVLLNAWILCDEAEIGADDLEVPGVSGRSLRASETPASSTSPFDAQTQAEVTQPIANTNRSFGNDELDEPSGNLPATPARRTPGSRDTLSSHRRTEKDRIIDALKAANWNRVKAAELSGIPRRTFYRRLREYKIQ